MKFYLKSNFINLQNKELEEKMNKTEQLDDKLAKNIHIMKKW